MDLKNLVQGFFKKRVNRFVAEIELMDKSLVYAHLANTGRMSELLIEDSQVLIEKVSKNDRKTEYDLLFVKNKNNNWIMLKASYANDLFYNWLNLDLLSDFRQVQDLKREVKLGNSRFDFCFSYKSATWIGEIKSVNYFDKSNAIFPDAPTIRGAKHIKELINLKNKGYQPFIGFILMGEPANNLYFNDITDSNFVDIINIARVHNILIKAYQADFSKKYPFYSTHEVKIGGLDGNLCISRI